MQFLKLAKNPILLRVQGIFLRNQVSVPCEIKASLWLKKIDILIFTYIIVAVLKNL